MKDIIANIVSGKDMTPEEAEKRLKPL